jgi:anti-anti-sigma regulatory factor
MIKNITIKIEEFTSPIISSRIIIDDIEKIIQKSPVTEVTIDFDKIEFISRSAAHQLLLMKDKLAHK